MKVITEKEKPFLINSIIGNQENPTTESVMKDLQLIDDLLVLQKQRILFMPKLTKTGKLRKDASLKKIIEMRIEQSL